MHKTPFFGWFTNDISHYCRIFNAGREIMRAIDKDSLTSKF